MIKEIKELESKLVCRFPELADMSRILSKWITEELLVRLKLRIKELHSICGIKDASIETSIKMYRNLEKELTDIKEVYKNIIDEKCAGDEKHCTCVPALRKMIEELENEVMKLQTKQIHIIQDELRVREELQSLKEKLTVEKFEKVLFDKFGFSEVDIKHKNWRALRLRESAREIIEELTGGEK